MYLMYVDESGDCGMQQSPTRYFVLTGVVVHELRWRDCLDALIDFRQKMRERFGLKLREEIHAAAMVSRPGGLVRIRRNDRLWILRQFADSLSSIVDLNVINVVVDKSDKGAEFDVFDTAWRALIQRFENTLSYRNFRGPANADDRGIVFPDHTDDKKLTGLLRKLRRFNPIPHRADMGRGYRNLPVGQIVEDPCFRDSGHSYFIQSADLCAFLLYQRLCPNSYMKKTGGQAYFHRLRPILCTVASASDPDGIVRL